jgi:hypothetical protein
MKKFFLSLILLLFIGNTLNGMLKQSITKSAYYFTIFTVNVASGLGAMKKLRKIEQRLNTLPEGKREAEKEKINRIFVEYGLNQH